MLKYFIYYFEQELHSLNKKIFIKNISEISKEKNSLIDETLINALKVVTPTDLFFDKSKNMNFNQNNSYFNYNFQEESLKFKFEVYEKLSSHYVDFKNNLTSNEIIALNSFILYKQFKITETDKNIGITVSTHRVYNELAFEHLKNDTIYSQINNLTLTEINNKIKTKIETLLIDAHINKKLAKHLIIDDDKVRFGKFRLMPKIHKSKFGIRPIINCNQHPTSKISLLIDCLLKPIVAGTESYIKDSQHLIQKTQFLHFQQDCSLFSCDFESLYTNILLADACNYICDFVKDKLDFNYISIFGFKTILEILFSFNYFTFNQQVYKQNSGVAMGTISAPNIANIYVYCLEVKFLNIHRPLFYCRFIDDIFIIVKNSFDIQILINSFNSLTLNIVTDKIVNFLNLNISLCKFTGKLLFSMYFKPTNTFSYLLNSSNHPSHIYKNIPFGLFYTIRRICSDLSSFLFNTRKIYYNLQLRGYDSKLLIKTSNTVALMQREKLIPYKNRIGLNNCLKSNDLVFKMPFDCNLNEKTIDLKNSFKNSIENNQKLLNSNLRIIYTRQFSIRDLFINYFSTNINTYSYKKCFNKFCLICYFSNVNNCVYLNRFPLFCLKNSTCSSENCIYLIKCKLCLNYFYVGQTIDIGQRMKQHISDSLSFVTFVKYTSVSIHFNLKNHNIFEHFSFFVINSNLLKEKLTSNENYYINLFKNLNMNLMNEKHKIPDIKYLKYNKMGDFR